MKCSPKLSLIERLLVKAVLIPETECLEWTAAKDSSGYGSIGFNKKQLSTHRAMYMSIFSVIPENTCIIHTCDNPACINPFHLCLGTHKDNMDDMKKKGRKAILKGDNHPKAKLTEKQVGYIKTTTEESVSDLANRFFVSKSLIRKIRSGERRQEFTQAIKK